jgi:hypothetical protein
MIASPSQPQFVDLAEVIVVEKSDQKFDRVITFNISATTPSRNVVRWGREPTEAELMPRTYRSGDGGEVEVTLRAAAPRAEFDEALKSYRFRGVPFVEVRHEFALGATTFTKPYTAFMGATLVFGCANIRDLRFLPLDPPYPDLRMEREGRTLFVEVTQVRREAELFELYRGLEKRSRDELARVPSLALAFADRSICITFVHAPKTRDCDRFVSDMIMWLTKQDLVDRPQIEVTDPWLRRYVRVVSIRRPNPERPISFARHGNVPARTDAVDAFASLLEKKVARSYVGTPLWLAVTVLDEPDALMLRLREINFGIGNFERVIVTDQQDVLTLKRI